MYEFFDESNWLSSSQSLFKPGDTCINQLISITHDIYKSFNEGYKVRGSLSWFFRSIWYSLTWRIPL